ncbi:DUF3320 domain-containing protein [Aquisalimonas lutea]|uniref:DUF3320 domain-containing protein n=1 Tax=Aquisalimonas lutea TaxID=1327750 RepID=UPI0025B48838|nr:DUF3320 domain-containing protein [Aquisalimonas lutea]MDN3519792.1 DUF3320 domain-containing protein [Aquisalimonas lutea]
MSDALHPGWLDPPERWTPTFEPIALYQAVDSAELGLAGTESFHDIADDALDRAVLRVVDGEGPVHFRALADRLLTAADVGRLGSRIRARIESHLEGLEEGGRLERRDDFIGRWQQFLVPPFRDWGEAPEKTRQLDHVHDSELMLCLFRAVLEEEGIDADTAMNNGLYRIGFTRLTDNARERLEAPLQRLIDEAMLTKRGESITLGPEAFVRRSGPRPA